MNTLRIRHANPSRTVTAVTDFRLGRAEKGEYVMNPSRGFVTDSEGVKSKEYIGNNTLSLFIYESVTYPLAPRLSARTRVCEGVVTDSRDGFGKEDCP